MDLSRMKNGSEAESVCNRQGQIYLRKFASEQITPKEQADELLRMNTSKDKLFYL
jgi:hypothetical protein